MTDDLVKAAREALVGVTEGPWATDQDKSPSDVYCSLGSNCISRWPTRTLTECDTNYFDGNANARFIAAARSLVPAMADRIEELEAKVGRLREVLLIAESLEAWAQCARDGRPIYPSVVGLTDMARTLRAIADDSAQKGDTP
jgi:hypothetical protein